ncbi:MAG: hypothetical protein KGS61_02245 [Verrucomicrobia bacterium]|nr:hypothetical protein [Verrucomicrobiota bacterium]
MKLTWTGVLLVGWAAGTTALVAETDSGASPGFQEVYDLLTNAPGVTAAALNRAAVQGMLNRFAPVASLEAAAPTHPTAGALLSKTAVFDGAYAYLRVARVGARLGEEIGSAYGRLSATNKLKGLVLDLRFADGEDYAAAAAAADKFLSTDQPLLRCGDQLQRSTAKHDAISLPLMVLVNQQTAGAAEALAGVLRRTEAGLLLGTNTAGRAYLFKDFTLRDGQRLRVATTTVKLGDGQPLPAEGLKPDIRISVKPDEERLYFADPYRVLTNPAPVLFASSTVTNADTEPVHRINEAELVRRQKEGQNLDDAPEEVPGPGPDAARPVVQDPTLSRALDLLKGLAVVQQQLRQP